MDKATKSLIDATLARRAKSGVNMRIVECGFHRSFPTAEARDEWIRKVERKGRRAETAYDWKSVK